MAVSALERLEGKPTTSIKVDAWIPNPFTDPVAEARESYSRYYAIIEEPDSPPMSRRSLIERLYPHTVTLPVHKWILDIGAGRQVLEQEYDAYLDKKGIWSHCEIITLDIANLKAAQLLGGGFPHVQASGDLLPFPDNTFPLVVSNMALDFMSPQAKKELYRVVEAGGRVFLNLHHPSLAYGSDDLRREFHSLLKRAQYRKTNGRPLTDRHLLRLAAVAHRMYMAKTNRYYSSKMHIAEDFSLAGFRVERTAFNEDNEGNKWWEVDMVKPVAREGEVILFQRGGGK